MPATETASKPRAGERVELRRYRIPDGERILVGQRIEGRVALIDIPAGDDGQVYLLEREVKLMAELTGIVNEYADRSERVGMPALLASRRLGESCSRRSDEEREAPRPDRHAPAPGRRPPRR